MHVVYIVQEMTAGGLERVVLLLARELLQQGHKVTICCLDKVGMFADRAKTFGACVELLHRREGVDIRLIVRLARWLRRLKPDAVHMHNETALFYGTLSSMLARVPVRLYTEHDGRFPRSLPARWANRFLVRHLTQAVAVSEAVRRLWCESDGIPIERVRVIPNGVPDTGARPHFGLLRGEHWLIGFVGRLSTEKGVDVLIEAFALVRQHLPQARLILAGDGPERAALCKRASDMNLRDSVDFLGERDDVPAILAGLSVFVLPSRSEGLPMALLEAMAAGLPIVATAVGGVPEAIRDNDNGLLVCPNAPREMAAAIVGLAQDEALRERIGGQAHRDFLEKYHLSHMVDAYAAAMGAPREALRR
ncbi:MAG: glycosyltransferase family 4 protein [Planctomycetes bacterium]|nr:glycosyltransferase family 4 protein [Planctomycetota bacterium]